MLRRIDVNKITHAGALLLALLTNEYVDLLNDVAGNIKTNAYNKVFSNKVKDAIDNIDKLLLQNVFDDNIESSIRNELNKLNTLIEIVLNGNANNIRKGLINNETLKRLERLYSNGLQIFSEQYKHVKGAGFIGNILTEYGVQIDEDEVLDISSKIMNGDILDKPNWQQFISKGLLDENFLNKIGKFTLGFELIRTIYGTKFNNFGDFVELLKKNMLEFQKFIDDKTKQQLYANRINSLFSTNGELSNVLLLLYSLNQRSVQAGTFSTILLPNIFTKFKLTEGLRGDNGELSQVADLLSATIGLKAKATTGVVIDLFLQLAKDTSDFYYVIGKGISMIDLINTYFRQIDDIDVLTEQLMSIIQKISGLPQHDIDNDVTKEFVRQFGALIKLSDLDLFSITDLLSRLRQITINNVKYTQQQKNVNRALQLINFLSDELLPGALYYRGAQRYIRNILGPESIDSTPSQLYSLIYKQLSDIETEMYGTAMSKDSMSYNVLKKIVEDVKQDIKSGIVEDILLKLQNRVSELMLNGYSQLYLFYRAVQEMEDLGNVDINITLAKDLQKTVDKSNKYVVLGVLKTLVSDKDFTLEKYKELVQQSMYRAFQETDVLLARSGKSQFKGGEVLNRFKKYQQQGKLDMFGFGADIVNKDFNEFGDLLEYIQSNNSGLNISGLVNLLVYDMNQNIKTVLESQNINQYIKDVVLYKEIGSVLELSKVIEGKDSDKLLRNQLLTALFASMLKEELIAKTIEEFRYNINTDFNDNIFKLLDSFMLQLSDLQLETPQIKQFIDNSLYDVLNKFNVSKTDFEKYIQSLSTDTAFTLLTGDTAKKIYLFKSILQNKINSAGNTNLEVIKAGVYATLYINEMNRILYRDFGNIELFEYFDFNKEIRSSLKRLDMYEMLYLDTLLFGNMLQMRFVRRTKGRDLSTPRSLYNTVFKKVKPFHYLGNIPDMNLFVPPLLRVQTKFITGETLDDVDLLKNKKKGLLRKIDEVSKQVLDDNVDELVDSDTASEGINVGMTHKLFYTGAMHNFNATKLGGLVVFLGTEQTYETNYKRVSDILYKVFVLPKETLSLLEMKLLRYFDYIKKAMFTPIELMYDMPVGLFALAGTIKTDVLDYTSEQMLANLYSLLISSKTKNVEKFQFLRAIFLSNKKATDIDAELVDLLKNKLSQNVLIQLFEKHGSIKDVDYFLEKLDTDFGIKITKKQYDGMLEALEKYTKQMYVDYKQNIKTFDLNETAEYLLMPYKFSYEGINMAVVPHQLVDAISLSSPNSPGLVSSFKPYGHLASPIQEMLNPVLLLTDSVRAINTYYLVALDVRPLSYKEYKTKYGFKSKHEEQMLDILEEINLKNRSKYMLDVEVENDQLFKGKEAAGTYALTLIVDKPGDNPSVDNALRAILGTDLTLEGDLYFVSRTLHRLLKQVDRGEFGVEELTDLPDLFKITGPVRSKGMSTFLFDKEVVVDINGVTLPVMIVMNTQGKRKNKLLEFGLGLARLFKFLSEYKSEYKQLIAGQYGMFKTLEDLEKALEFIKQPIKSKDIKNIDEVQNKFFDLFLRSRGRIKVFDPQTQRYVDTGETLQVVMQKIYFYTSKSHDVSFTELSTLALQVIPQNIMFKHGGLMKLLFLSDGTERELDKQVLARNMIWTISEGLLLQNMAELFQGRYAGSYGNAQIMDILSPFLKLFDVSKDRLLNNNLQKLKYFLESMRKLSSVDERFEKTLNVLDILSDIMNNERTINSLGSSVVKLSEAQARQLAELYNEEIFFPMFGTYVFKKGKRTNMKAIESFVSFSERFELLEYISVKSGNILENLPMLKVRVGQLFDASARNGLTLGLDSETLINLYLGLYSILKLVAEQDERQMVQLMKFYSQRMLSLFDSARQRFLDSLSKRHGYGLAGLHLTASDDIGGVRLPKKAFEMLVLSLVKAGAVSEHTVRNILGDTEYNNIMGISLQVTEEEFEKWSKQAILVGYTDHNRQFHNKILLSPDLSKYTNKREVLELLKNNLPFLPTNMLSNSGFIEFATDRKMFNEQVAIQLLFQYQGMLKVDSLRKLLIPSPSDVLRLIKEGILGYLFAGEKGFKLLELYRSSYGEMWGYLQRHPIIGHMPHVRIVGFSDNNTIDVPKYLAGKIAGDDDGDMINLLPYVLINRQIFRQYKTQIPKVRYGMFDITLARMELYNNLAQISFGSVQYDQNAIGLNSISAEMLMLMKRLWEI